MVCGSDCCGLHWVVGHLFFLIFFSIFKFIFPFSKGGLSGQCVGRLAYWWWVGFYFLLIWCW